MSEQTKDRNQIDEQYTWRLSDIFASTGKWEEDLKTLEEPLLQLLSYKERVGDSAQTLANTLDLDQECSIRIMELYAYAKMNKDLDNADPVYQAMYDRIVGEYFNLSARTSFIAPSISKIEEQTLRSWMKSEERLQPYEHYLDDIIRNKKHILSENEEKILSQAGPMADGISEVFSMMNDLELDFGEIEQKDGQKTKLTHGKFGVFSKDKDRDIRSQAYGKMHAPYQKFGNTLSAIYANSVRSDVFFTKARGFESCLDRALFADNLTERIYTRLIASVHERLPAFYRYMSLRKKQLKLDVLHLYDCSVPIVEITEKEYGYEQGRQIVLDGLSHLGKEYLGNAKEFLSSRSVDVFETPGKTSGAYAWGTYRSHPFMLLNWSGRLNDIFTLAHETGHCMHTLFSDRAQSYVNSHYPIFLAEIASTVNENVLLRHMIEACDTTGLEGKKEKAYLLNYFLEGVKNTVFRQTMFAEFEWLVHQKAEQGQPLTSATLCETYTALLRLYFGDEVVIDEYMSWEWARVPHFYNAFYVYKYATGFCAATQIADLLFKNGADTVARYTAFLSAGGKDYPLNLLNEMGIDMTSPQAVGTTMDEFENYLGLLEDLLEQIGE